MLLITLYQCEDSSLSPHAERRWDRIPGVQTRGGSGGEKPQQVVDGNSQLTLTGHPGGQGGDREVAGCSDRIAMMFRETHPGTYWLEERGQENHWIDTVLS